MALPTSPVDLAAPFTLPPSSSPAAATGAGASAAKETLVQQLVAMSFPEAAARHAVEASNALTVDAALGVLYGDPTAGAAEDSPLQPPPPTAYHGGGGFDAGNSGGDSLLGEEELSQEEIQQLYGGTNCLRSCLPYMQACTRTACTYSLPISQ